MKVQNLKLPLLKSNINELDTQKKEMTVVSKIDGIIVKVNQNIAKIGNGAQMNLLSILFQVNRIK